MQQQSHSTPAHSWSARQLLEGFASWEGDDVTVSDMTLDSRAVRTDSLFIALAGTRTHGLQFAAQAIAQGASVVLYEPAPSIAPPARSAARALPVANLRSRLGALADRFFGSPSARLTIAAVTGTNGKTTSAFLIPAALEALGRRAAYAGTLGFGVIDALQPSAHTTPDCITVHRQLASMRDAGQTHLGMEASSHALDQGRIDGVRVQTALFTNLTRDHLDYHGTMEAYGAAKEKLFERVELSDGVINVRDAFGFAMAQRLKRRSQRPRIVACALDAQRAAVGDAQLFATQVERTARGMMVAIDGSWGKARLQTRLIGAFNVENLLGALGVLLTWKIPLSEAVSALERCAAPPGRMEAIARADRPLVVVDYAHTPDALSKALQTLREHCTGKLICIFGCGGDRDPGKRPQMGEIAARLADVVVVTDDNPRTEDPNAIVADILRGVPAHCAVMVERDRERAIARALQAANPNDAILLAGKGHEDYQIVGERTLHFSDREVAQRLLERAA